MAELKKVEDELEARTCLAAAKAAGISPGDWARAHGIDGRSLNAWRVNLSRRSESSPRPRRRSAPRAKAPVGGARLVELVPRASADGGRYVIWLGDVAVGDDFREDTLGRIASALRAC